MNFSPDEEELLRALMAGEAKEGDPTVVEAMDQRPELRLAWRELCTVVADLESSGEVARGDAAAIGLGHHSISEERALEGFRRQLAARVPDALDSESPPTQTRQPFARKQIVLAAAAALLILSVGFWTIGGGAFDRPSSVRQLGSDSGVFVTSPEPAFGSVSWTPPAWATSYDVSVWSPGGGRDPVASAEELIDTRWSVPPELLLKHLTTLRWTLIVRDETGAELARDTWVQSRD